MAAEDEDSAAALTRAVEVLARVDAGTDARLGALETLLLGFAAASRPIRPAAVAAITATLATPGLEAVLYDRCLQVLAAVAYGSPALIDDAAVTALGRVLQARELPAASRQLAGDLLTLVVTSPAAPAAVTLVHRLLLDARLAPDVRARLVRLLGHGAVWRADLLPLEDMVALAGVDHLRSHRAALLGAVIERIAFTAPGSFTPGLLERLRALYGRHRPFRYLVSYLAARRETPPETARVAARLLRRRFPCHAAVRARLGRGSRRALVVHNISDGQGDELIRVGPLTQALLDFNPDLRVTLVTRRTYLYEHPQVTPVPIADDGAVRALLSEPFDIVVNFYEGYIPRLHAYRPELEVAIAEYVRDRSPFLHLVARKAMNYFVYETVAIDGAPWARRLGLDRRRVGSVYEPTCRLLAELGLPLRAGQESPRAGFLFAGRPCPAAADEWARLSPSHPVTAERGEAERPVVLLNPFGGRHPLKGYVSGQFDTLAREIAGLATEGFAVVLLPNGTPWGTGAVAADVAARVPPEARRHVTVAPDPAGAGGGIEPDAPADARADRIMGWFKHFVAYADLVVTVEGWMMHLAYQMGKPCRVLLMASSHARGWFPHGATCRQAIVTGMSRATGELTGEPPTLAGGPPAPGYPRKDALCIVLRGLGEIRAPGALALLRHAQMSPDGGIRAEATEALGRQGDPAVEPLLRAALGDRARIVRAAAARALLAGAGDRSWPLGRDEAVTLRCHVLIGGQRWAGVLAVGKAALHALSAATNDEDPVVRRAAISVFWQLVGGKGFGLLAEYGAATRAPDAVLS